MTIARRKVAELLMSCGASYFDQEQDQLVQSLNNSRHNIEKSMIALHAIARAEAACRDIEGEMRGPPEDL